MLGGHEIDAITNGAHAATWVSPPFAALFDRHIPGWRRDNFSLRYAAGIPRHEVWEAQVASKLRLIELVNRSPSLPFDPSFLTFGFARRASAYKRADLIASDLDRLRAVSAGAGRFQIVFAGKAHPHDEEGKHVIERVFRAREALRNDIAIAYLEDYDITQAALLTAGSDVWLNTPKPPLEASGTSGMKAALNGVPSLSVLDGWWLEGHVEGVTGWAIGTDGRSSLEQPVDSATHAEALYDTLEQAVLPLFYQRREVFIDVSSRQENAMTLIPTQVTFRGLPHSDALEADIRGRVDWLGHFYDGVTHEPSLHGSVRDALGEAHHKKAELENVHRFAHVAVHEAFDAARRRLEDFARKQRGTVKLHEPPAHGRIAEISRADGYGFIQTDDGRVYFNRASVLGGAFDELAPGAFVTFVEEQGDKGPQASTVRVLGKHHYVAP